MIAKLDSYALANYLLKLKNLPMRFIRLGSIVILWNGKDSDLPEEPVDTAELFGENA